MRNFFRLLLGLLREIGDENAYARHLKAHGREHSAAEWRRFSEERFEASTRGPSAVERNPSSDIVLRQ